MNDQPYALLSSWGRPNMQNREWLAQTEDDKESILTNENMVAGDKVYVIESKARYVLGLDLKWYNAKAGGSANLENVEVEYTANDTYTLEPSSGYDGIGSAEITVNVEPALETLEEVYLENGEYTIRPTAGVDGISEVAVTVNVSGGGGSSEPTVFLYDYDGTVIASYTPSQFATLSAYPAAPAHEGLTFQEYNWPLATAKEYVANYGRCDIGATYTTSDGKTRIYITTAYGGQSVELYASVNGTATIDWGDDSSSSTLTGDSLDTVLMADHEYSESGDYIIVITPPAGDEVTMRFMYQDSSPFISPNNIDYTTIERMECGGNVDLGNSALYGLTIYSVVAPIAATTVSPFTYDGGDSYYNGVGSLRHITIPNGVTEIGENAFSYLMNLGSISFPPTITTINSGAMCYCNGLHSVCIPPLVDTMGEYVLGYCFGLKEIILPEDINVGDCLAACCRSLQRITLPHTDLSNTPIFGDSSHQDEDIGLNSLDIPEGVTGIPWLGFCPAITSLSIPSSVTAVSCMPPYLREVEIPSGVNVDYHLFEWNSHVESVRISSSELPEYVFSSLPTLRDLVLTSDVSSLGDHFIDEGCSRLRMLKFEGSTPPDASYYTFEYLPVACKIYVPQGSLEAYTSAENYPDPADYTYVEYPVE